MYPDLTPLPGRRGTHLGLRPLAVGFLRGDRSFPQGSVPDGFLDRLLTFCYQEYTLPGHRRSYRCALSRECPRRLRPLQVEGHVIHFEDQIRVLGRKDIFAAPVMITHYITEHGYLPPQPFIDAVMNGPSPESDEHRVLIATLLL